MAISGGYVTTLIPGRDGLISIKDILDNGNEKEEHVMHPENERDFSRKYFMRPVDTEKTKYNEMSTPRPWMREKFISTKSGFAVDITKVIFNSPATIVYWSDGTRTVVKANNEPFDPEKGLAMAITKKFLGNEGNYYNTIKKWVNNNGN